jgi:hypothetical protein
MKKRRGKQPVKPNLEEAMKERIISLKGKQFSTMNIPIIFRRTFNWDADTVLFKPINRRSFVVYSSDMDQEEMQPLKYIRRRLKIEDLPWYSDNRVGSDPGLPSTVEELRESLVSLSLTDRYVHIEIPRPEDRNLDEALRSDLENLAKELGYRYSSLPDIYRCTFVFPQQNNSVILKRASDQLAESLEMMIAFALGIYEIGAEDLSARVMDLKYSIDTEEVVMDSLYTQSLNILWDLPQTEMAGHFIVIQSCERAQDELQYIMEATARLSDLLDVGGGEIDKLFREELISVWRTSVRPALESVKRALDMLDLDNRDAARQSLGVIRSHRHHKVTRTSPQDGFQTELTNKIERTASSGNESGLFTLSTSQCIESVELLFSINQSAHRLYNISQIIATKILYMMNSEISDTDQV